MCSAEYLSINLHETIKSTVPPQYTDTTADSGLTDAQLHEILSNAFHKGKPYTSTLKPYTSKP